ncbi:zonular occludens toxin domain-containing protein [Chromobacterium subtsugae]|uniref:zonular occludens toxin domain-containing protein n=1 Tax=Chromobacterium subtsugae TaxID=251747 RepID=UPI0007F87E56|nr:zonular occludens toxin domain-containing protein [Chromobacterium subtsugae]
MIYLVTAVPGSGKSLYTLDWLRKKSDNESRQVYYNNIPLSKTGLDLLQWIEFPDPTKWMHLPPGAIFVMDECQFSFPVRKSGKDTPEHIEKFSTHRHLGIDIVLITQHPGLLDSFIRRLVGTHIHLVRQFGAERSTVLTWQEGCQENPNSKSAQKACLDRRTFVFPKEVYSWYKSAEAHTHKFQMPLRLKQMIMWLIAVVFLIAASVWYLYHNMIAKPREEAERLQNKTNASQPVSQTPSPQQSQNAGQGGNSNQRIIKTAQTFLQDRQPRVDGIPESAPAYDELTTPKTFPKVTACVASNSKCSCYNQQGGLIQMDDYRCRYYVDKGWFDPYMDKGEMQDRQIMASRQNASAPAAIARQKPARPEVLAMSSSNIFPRIDQRKGN